jgi:hypothetical protein
MKAQPNTVVQPIGIRGEGTNIAKDDKPIRLNRNLIHQMISSKTTQKPASTV